MTAILHDASCNVPLGPLRQAHGVVGGYAWWHHPPVSPSGETWCPAGRAIPQWVRDQLAGYVSPLLPSVAGDPPPQKRRVMTHSNQSFKRFQGQSRQYIVAPAPSMPPPLSPTDALISTPCRAPTVVRPPPGLDLVTPVGNWSASSSSHVPPGAAPVVDSGDESAGEHFPVTRQLLLPPTARAIQDIVNSLDYALLMAETGADGTSPIYQ